ncbi:hypothetical protein [Desulfobacula sp.]|uniref:hypothetical protein n=1 Tax=Desulfobacula sp. TaxID=2593537 RepID=UPI0025B9371C|nr:hypothetical protein [Desulfobacula sp.]MBC2704488.1 hypothetical protein [Desulfobacula sp.]
MSYIRPKSDFQLTPEEKKNLLQEYFDFYTERASQNPHLLNSKIPRDEFDDLLNDIGSLIIKKAESFSNSDNSVSRFLYENSLPEHLEYYLPKQFRVFCLALNALKQWLSAEQAATDRYILGGTVRSQCKNADSKCLVTGKPASECKIELHHPVRDGRPPIPISKEAHALIEGQNTVGTTEDEIMKIIYPIKRQGNRSWVMLKLGCELLLGIANTTKSKNVQSSSKTFARKASAATNLNFTDIINWIDENSLV